MEYWRSFFDVYFMPGSMEVLLYWEVVSLGKMREIRMPMIIAMTGAPIIGNVWPRRLAGMARAKHSRIPGRMWWGGGFGRVWVFFVTLGVLLFMFWVLDSVCWVYWFRLC